jgi:hypothetical protein
MSIINAPGPLRATAASEIHRAMGNLGDRFHSLKTSLLPRGHMRLLGAVEKPGTNVS